MFRKIKYGLYSILVAITVTISSVVGIFAAFNANVGGGVHITYEYIQIPVEINESNYSSIVTRSRDTVISWDSAEQAVKMAAHDLDGVNIFYDGTEYLIFDVGAFIDFGTNSIDASLYKILVLECKFTEGCRYNDVTSVYPTLDIYENDPQPGFFKSLYIPITSEYIHVIVDFTDLASASGAYTYSSGNLTGFRLDYFDLRDSVDYAEQGLLLKSVTMCQTLAAAERLFG